MAEPTPTPTASATNTDLESTPHFESCFCPIHPSITPLPLDSRTPDSSDPVLPGQCIYHHRLSTREAESAIFIQLAPEIDELKEVLSSGMVKFKHSSGAGQVVLKEKKATSEELDEASTGLKALIAERDGLVQAQWSLFVGRWGGRVERRDDGTMFVVDAGKVLEEEEDEEDEEDEEEAAEEDEAEAEAKEGTNETEEDEHSEQKAKKGKTKTKRKGKARANNLDESIKDHHYNDDEADPYVKRMKEVQARMDDLQLAEERKGEKRAKAAADQ